MGRDQEGSFSWAPRVPPVHELPTDEQRLAWIGSYVTTVLERDFPALGVRIPSSRLLRFWTMLTHLNGRLLNVTELAHSMELSTAAVGHYLDILEGSIMVMRLQPHFSNTRKRLVKQPKLYVRDTGILHWLSGLRRQELEEPRFSFYRTQAGAEVDLLVEDGARITPIEVTHGVSAAAVSSLQAAESMPGLQVLIG